ncbi:hypothetical protein B0O99DRAFT_684264 [Bisporella sp. PMI_857]|nr:hypothetical protein B0O99DRAFT_684264 [Bisporella sp. PMI_857]
MGRFESLVTWALGRSPYEDEVIQTYDVQDEDGIQQQRYNYRGHPRNPETKRRERAQVRAANEVMEVTGIVEDHRLAKRKALKETQEKLEETYMGLKLLELGRLSLIGGVWGVLGLRRRILLYKPYAERGILSILKQEVTENPTTTLLFRGLPAVITLHFSDYAGFLISTIFDQVYDHKDLTTQELWLKRMVALTIKTGFGHMVLHYRLFATLQQVHIFQGNRYLPSAASLIPFSQSSPLQFPTLPQLNKTSLMTFGLALLRSASPILAIYLYSQSKVIISTLIRRPIYQLLPRPMGEGTVYENIFPNAFHEPGRPDRSGTEVYPDTPRRLEDAETLRRLEGHPVTRPADPEFQRSILSGQPSTQPLTSASFSENSDAEDEETQQPTLISFDVEPSENVGTSGGTWSAELRSANESPKSKETKYRVTGMTMLPTILASEGLRDIVAGMIAAPIEAMMIRIVARAYQDSAGLDTLELYEAFNFRSLIPAAGNLFGTFTLQTIVIGAHWVAFIEGSRWFMNKDKDEETMNNE